MDSLPLHIRHIIGLLAACAMLAPLQFVGAAIFEPGFEVTTVASGLTLPTSMTFSPDGRIFIAEKGGTVRVIHDGHLHEEPVITLTDINTFGDRGLIGIATDPNFVSNGYLYLSYTYENTPGANVSGPKTGRIVRVTVAGDTADEASKVVLVGTVGGDAVNPSCSNFAMTADCVPSDAASHSVGGLRFGQDGKLYASLGDGAHFDFVDPNSQNAQRLDSLAGKILRINTDGSAPSDNPYYTGDAQANRSKVYALGVRNAFRFNFNAATGALFAGDVGWSDWEEVNRVTPGANFGWPCYEGLVKTIHNCEASSATTSPLYHYQHNAAGAGSVAMGAFGANGAYPAQYATSLFVGDYAQNWIKRVALNGDGSVASVSDFMDDPNGPVDITTGPDGTLYYLAIYTGELMRITHTTGNRQPVVVVAANPTSGLLPLTVNFSSVGTYDPDAHTLSYFWTFGDGATSNLVNPSHTYTAQGSRTAVLTVTDSLGASVSKSVTIAAGAQAPTAQITSPASGFLYAPNQVIALQGSATDPEDGVLPASAFHWDVILHHNTHTHNIISFDGTTAPSFSAPDHDATDVYTQIVLTVTDSNGLTNSQSINLYINNGAGTGNLIVNPSVETPDVNPARPLNWTTSWWGVLDPVFTYPVAGLDGDKAMKVELRSYTSGDAKWFFSPVFVSPGKTYHYHSHYTATVPTSQVAQFGYDNGTYSYAYMQYVPASVTTEHTEYDILVPENVRTLTVFHVITEVGELVIDNASLTLNTTDTTAPSVILTAPVSGTNTTGTLVVSATATDDTAVAGVALLIDGTALPGEDTEAPYAIVWNSTSVADGAHELSVRARDAAGNTATSGSVSVTVQNNVSTTNLIQNPSFETEGASGDPHAWARGGWGTNNRVFTYPVLGAVDTKGARVEITSYTNGDAKWYFADVPVTGSTTYDFSHQYRSNVGTQLVARYTLLGGGFQYASLGSLPASTAWSPTSYTFTAPANATAVTVFHIVKSVGYLEVDAYALTTDAPAQDSIVPSVAVTSPINNAAVSNTVTLAATASDNVGVSKVAFYAAETLVAEDTTAPYTALWNTTLASNGTSSVYARAFDVAGNSATSSVVTVTVNNTTGSTTNLIQNGSLEIAAGTSPLGWSPNSWGNHTAVHTYPVQGPLGGAAVRTEITSYAANGTGDSKWFFTKVPVTPGTTYTYKDSYRSNTISDVIGQYTLTNGTFHYFGLVKEVQPTTTWASLSATFTPPVDATHVTFFHLISAVGYVEIDNVELYVSGNGTPSETIPPIVEFTNPLPGQTVSGTTTITASSTDNVGVTYVFYAVDGIPITGQITESPYAFAWNTRTHTDGPHTLKATTHDPSGNNTTATITVIVNNTTPPEDAVAPAVAISAPIASSTLSGTVAVDVAATDNVGVTSVTLVVDASVLGTADTSAPYTFTLDTTLLSNGIHTLQATARDAAGNIATSSSVSVVVQNSAPTINLIQNSSLEFGTTSPVAWMSNAWGNSTRTFTYPVPGSDGLKAARVDVSDYVSGDAKWYFEDVAVEPGVIYTFTHAYRASAVSNVTIRYTRPDQTVFYVGLGNEPATETWTTLTESIFVPTNVASMTIFHSAASNGYLEVDDYQLSTGTSHAFANGMVSFTFDDGWLSQYTEALPLLNAANVDGVFYIIAQETANASNAELVPNADLESTGPVDPQSWHRGGWGQNTTVHTYPAVGVSGNAVSVEITEYIDGDAKWYFDDVTVTPSYVYHLKDAYKSTVASDVLIRYTKADSTVEYVFLASLPASGDTWAQFEQSITIPENVVSATVFHTISGVGALTIDNVSLKRNENFVSRTQMLAMQAAGHEIGSHTQTHPHLTEIGVGEANNEIEDSKIALQNMGVIAVNSIAYPYGDYNDTVANLARDRGYSTGRSVDRGYNTRDTNPYALKIQQMDRTTTLLEVQSWVQQALTDKTWLILMFHQVNDDAQADLGVTPQLLEDVLTYVNSTTIEVVTVSEGVAQM